MPPPSFHRAVWPRWTPGTTSALTYAESNPAGRRRDTVQLATRRDPLAFELIKNALAGISDSMAVTVVRTARSFVVKQSMDFSTALCDANGELIAQGMCV